MEGLTALVVFAIGILVLILWIIACLSIVQIANSLACIAHVLEDFRKIQSLTSQPGVSPFSKAPPIPSRVP